MVTWDVRAALDAAAEVLGRAGEATGAADAAAMAAELPPAGPLPIEPPESAASLTAWVLRRLAVPTPEGADLLPEPLAAWRGRNLAVYGVWVPRGVVSFAVRWHGEHPALLWELSAPLTLRAPALAPGWSTTTLERRSPPPHRN